MTKGFQDYLVGWFQKVENQDFYEEERQLLNACLPNLFGFYLVQIGRISNENICAASRVNHKVLVDHKIPPAGIDFIGVNKVQADLDYLPIAKDCVDVIVLPHTLEVAADPHYLLRQVDAMLVPEGHLVISGFLPAGYLSWKNRWRSGKVKEVANNQEATAVYLESPHKIKEWLQVLGYDVQKIHYTLVGAHPEETGLRVKVVSVMFRVLDKFLRLFDRSLANSYCLVARKRVDSPTLVGLKWQMPRWKAVSGNLAQSRMPSAANQKNSHVEMTQTTKISSKK